MVRVLFVCMGNICRSPVAQGVFEELVRREGLEGEIEADSAGTHSYNLGKAPDERAQKSAAHRGIDIGSQRARHLAPEDCWKFDYVLVMDRENQRRAKRVCKRGATEVQLFLDYAPELPEREVPDPYHGGPEGFDLVMDLVEAASKGLLEDIRRRHLTGPVRVVSMRTEDAELLDRVPWTLRAVNGIPEPEQVAARERAAALASDALADLLLPDGVRTSPLGPGWSQNIDLHLTAWPEPARLEALGWVPLDPLLHRLGIPGGGRWAVVEDRRFFLAGLDLHLDPLPDPVAPLISRCRRRGEVRVREVLEARALLRAGSTLPDDPVIRVAARVEAGLGGQALARWRDGPALGAPASLPRRRVHRRWANVRSALRPRLVVAVSGIDGSGKSTLSRLVARNLEQVGVPVSLVRARLGSTENTWLGGLARAVKKLLPQNPTRGTARIARGVPAGDLVSRRGILGWTWVILVTLLFLVGIRQQHVRSRGILLYDYHFLDASVQLELMYEGVDLRLHRVLVRRGLPTARLSIYLDVPADATLARKPEESSGIHSREYAIRHQVEAYEACRGEVEDLRRLGGGRPADEFAAVVTRWIAEL